MAALLRLHVPAAWRRFTSEMPYLFPNAALIPYYVTFFISHQPFRSHHDNDIQADQTPEAQ
jgi:hypothetical protein